MRLPTFGKPRIISCASLRRNHLALPRGCFEETLELLRSHGVEVDIEDLRGPGARLDYRFLGTHRDDQQSAFDALSRHDCGVLAATTAFGKTVVVGVPRFVNWESAVTRTIQRLTIVESIPRS
jgi:hypothetical protein